MISYGRIGTSSPPVVVCGHGRSVAGGSPASATRPGYTRALDCENADQAPPHSRLNPVRRSAACRVRNVSVANGEAYREQITNDADRTPTRADG